MLPRIPSLLCQPIVAWSLLAIYAMHAVYAPYSFYELPIATGIDFEIEAP